MTSARTGTAATRRAAPPRRAPDWSFGDRIRKIRTDIAEMNQEQFATELSVTKPALAAWETGRTHPRDMVALAKRVELLSGVSAAWILGVESAPQIDPDGPGGSAATDSITARFPTGSSTCAEPFAQVISFPDGNRAVACVNGSSRSAGGQHGTGVTRTSYAGAVNRASAA